MTPSNKNRRQVIKTTGAATLLVGATGLAGFPSILKAENLGDKSTPLKIGLVGCGGRGTGAATQALNADPGVTLHAVADVFPEAITQSLQRLTSFGKRSEVPQERRFTGLDCYKQLIASGVDVVLLASPPGFRPQQLRHAVEQGKHVFAEKPMAVDMAGVHSVIASTKIAQEKNLCIQHGFCWRFAPSLREAYGQVLNGDHGRVTSVYGTYMGSRPKPLAKGIVKPANMGDVEWQIRWWNNFVWTSGGPLLEQAIHTVDKVAWAMGDVAPIAAIANGGRSQRDDQSNLYDHNNIAYEYPGNVICHVGQRQLVSAHAEVVDRVSCEKGSLLGPNRIHIKDHAGKTIWRNREREPQNMYQVCHNELFAAIRAGKVINTGNYMAQSTALAILGREAAYSGQRITWEEIMASKDDLAPDNLQLADARAVPPVRVPGQKKLG